VAGKQAYVIVAVAVCAVVFMLMFPTAKDAVDAVDTTGFADITTGGVTLLPYAVMGIIGYVLLKALRIL
jgi:hypothetical protein